MSANAQKVFRCGNTYSQSPCPDSVEVEVQDARSSIQKRESDARIRREAAAANAMEKQRIQEENRALAAARKREAEQIKATRHINSRKHDEHGSGQKGKAGDQAKSTSKKKEPEFFTARAVTDKTKGGTGGNANAGSPSTTKGAP